MNEEIQLKIERYILNIYTDEEEHQLWILFLESDEWYNYFDTELHLQAISNDMKP